MDAAPNVELVYQQICRLYCDADTREKEKASKWLDDFQKSIYSWTIADELLQKKVDLSSCYFAAQTMRNKIQTSFNELPADAHKSLRDSLLEHISQITNDSDPVIVTQLSLAVADLALLMASWRKPVDDLLKMFSTQPASVWPLLETLSFIPEEIDSRYLRLGANRREEVLKQLDASAPNVVEFLSLCVQMEPPTERILNSTLRCFCAWVALRVLPLHDPNINPIVKRIFELLSLEETSQKLHDTCTECVCAMLACIESNNNRNNTEGLLELHMFQNVCNLEVAFHMSVAQEDVDKTMNLSRIFSTLCEEFLHQMVGDQEPDQQPHYSIRAIDLVLACVGHFDYEVAEVTFHFWYRLSEMLFHQNKDQLTAQFRPHIERLLSALYRHVQMESDQEGLIDENDSFYDFRQKVSDLIKDVAFIIGSGACFKQMFLLLQTSNTTWEATEAALFIMQNVAKNILPDENEIVPKVIEAILHLPENTHIAVRYTSIIILGELCDWIECHPETLQAVLNFLLYGLQQRNGLASSAAIALTSICAACRSKMTCHIHGLIEIVRTLDILEIKDDLIIGLLKSISLILSRLPSEQLEPAMHEIISLQLQPLARLVEDPANTSSSIVKHGPNDPAHWIDRACAVIRHTNPDIDDEAIHPTVGILTAAWPLISSAMEKYQADCRIMERTCRLIRYGLRMVHKQALVLVEPLVEQLITLYTVQKHSCFLYLGSVLVDEFSRVETCTAGLLGMLNAFIAPTFDLLQGENGLQRNPDIVDDFFRLCSRFIECIPLPFLQSNLVTPVFQCALLACTLDHRDANSSAMKFFCLLLKWGHNTSTRANECRRIVKEIALSQGEVLVTNLVHASAFCLNSYMMPEVADVLYELKAIVSPDEMHQYLQSALNTLPKQNSGGFITASPQQLQDFTNDILKADTPKAVTQALRTFTRLFR